MPTDFMYDRDAEGHYDLVIDTDGRDLAMTEGLESAFMVSLFSDRRAREDEVADPLKRRGWIGDLVAEVPGDVHGSGLWLYEQSRLTGQVAVEVRVEAEQALEWMVQDRLVKAVSARVVAIPSERRIDLRISIGNASGGETVKAYTLADNTLRRHLVMLGGLST